MPIPSREERRQFTRKTLDIKRAPELISTVNTKLEDGLNLLQANASQWGPAEIRAHVGALLVITNSIGDIAEILQETQKGV